MLMLTGFSYITSKQGINSSDLMIYKLDISWKPSHYINVQREVYMQPIKQQDRRKTHCLILDFIRK